MQPVGVSSRFEKVRSIVQKNFPLVWFSSKEIQSVYEQELKEPVGLSTVSTYLARMAKKGFLLRNGSANNIKYKSSTATPQAVIRQKLK
jgi:predicted transcriptional regulator